LVTVEGLISIKVKHEYAVSEQFAQHGNKTQAKPVLSTCAPSREQLYTYGLVNAMQTCNTVLTHHAAVLTLQAIC